MLPCPPNCIFYIPLPHSVGLRGKEIKSEQNVTRLSDKTERPAAILIIQSGPFSHASAVAAALFFFVFFLHTPFYGFSTGLSALNT